MTDKCEHGEELSPSHCSLKYKCKLGGCSNKNTCRKEVFATPSRCCYAPIGPLDSGGDHVSAAQPATALQLEERVSELENQVKLLLEVFGSTRR
jgi:hypothetical protein